MQSTMRKFVGWFIVGSLCLLPPILSEVQAQPTATSLETAVRSTDISIEELKSKRLAIENMTDIDDTTKTESLKYIDGAIQDAALANNTNRKAADLAQLIQRAPDRIKILQAELKKPFTAYENVETRAQLMSTLKLEQRLLQKEAELANAQSRLQEWSDRLEAEKNLISQSTEQIANATSRVEDIQSELADISDAAETDIVNYSRMVSLKPELAKLTAEIKLNELRQRSYNLLVELLSLERDVAQKAVKGRELMLKTWQTQVQKRREQEAARAREDAQDAIASVPLLPKMVQDQFAININLSTTLEQMALEETSLAGTYEDYQSRLKLLEAEFETAKKRVESAVLTEAVGLALRAQRLKLPSTDRYMADSDSRKIKMSEISEKQSDRLLIQFNCFFDQSDPLLHMVLPYKPAIL